MTGNGGGALTTTPPNITGAGAAGGGGGGSAAAASTTGGGAKTNGGAPASDAGGGEAGLDDFGFSRNFPPSEAAAGADVGAVEAASGTNRGGAFTGAGGVAKSGGEGATTCGFAIADGGITAAKSFGAPSAAGPETG